MERDKQGYIEPVIKKISTHTLTWSVTGFSSKVCLDHMDFNSHAHVERDICGGDTGTYAFYFNSHAHVERDDILSDCMNEGEDFNSHAHVERDDNQRY